MLSGPLPEHKVMSMKNPLSSVLSLPSILRTVLAFCLFISGSQVSSANTGTLSALAITLQSDKQEYILGEPVSVTFKVVNTSNARIQLPGLIDVFAGQLVFRIAFENGPYRLYRGPGWYIWGAKTSKPSTLDPGASIETTATVLHNRAPQRGRLNEETWKRVAESEIDIELALFKLGRYCLKAILLGTIESPPLEIYINEPQTIDDIEMWKLMSKHPEYAYFMQTRGDLLQGTFTDQRTKEMVDTIESFVNYHAASTYTPYFREAIAKHRAAVERHRKAGTLKE